MKSTVTHPNVQLATNDVVAILLAHKDSNKALATDDGFIAQVKAWVQACFEFFGDDDKATEFFYNNFGCFYPLKIKVTDDGHLSHTVINVVDETTDELAKTYKGIVATAIPAIPNSPTVSKYVFRIVPNEQGLTHRLQPLIKPLYAELDNLLQEQADYLIKVAVEFADEPLDNPTPFMGLESYYQYDWAEFRDFCLYDKPTYTQGLKILNDYVAVCGYDENHEFYERVCDDLNYHLSVFFDEMVGDYITEKKNA